MNDPADVLGAVLDTVPSPMLLALADALEDGRSPLGVAGPAGDTLASHLDAMPGDVAAALIRGAVIGYQRGLATQQVEVVLGGPATASVPVRSTPQALADVIHAAKRELLLATYSATPYEPILVALYAARNRDVTVDILVETLAGAGSALFGREPAAAFADVPEVRLWHWPREQRPNDGAKMHAKLAVADREVMLVSSVNLTESGVEHSIEAGVLIRGGHAPRRVAEHIEQLRITGVLVRLS